MHTELRRQMQTVDFRTDSVDSVDSVEPLSVFQAQGCAPKVTVCPKELDSTTLSHVQSLAQQQKILHLLENLDSVFEAIQFGICQALLAGNFVLCVFVGAFW